MERTKQEKRQGQWRGKGAVKLVGAVVGYGWRMIIRSKGRRKLQEIKRIFELVIRAKESPEDLELKQATVNNE